MKKLTLFILLILSYSVQAQRFQNKKIIGFVQGDRNASNVDYANLTHAIFTFLKPNLDGTLQEIDASPDSKFINFINATQKANCKKLIAIGGMNSGSEIDQVAGNPIALHLFADTLVKFCKKYNFDGVDIDWEGLTSATDSNSYNRLMDTLDVHLHKEGLYLIADVAFTNYYGQWMPTHGLHKTDWINIMTYDATGWSNGPFGNHSSMQHMISGAYYWLARGFAKDKIVTWSSFLWTSF